MRCDILVILEEFHPGPETARENRWLAIHGEEQSYKWSYSYSGNFRVREHDPTAFGGGKSSIIHDIISVHKKEPLNSSDTRNGNLQGRKASRRPEEASL